MQRTPQNLCSNWKSNRSIELFNTILYILLNTIGNFLNYFRKHYFDVKRLEDGFDLTGPDCPKLDHPPLKAVSYLIN